ncbi:MAG: SemiSWEET transporter [Chitinophagaceae bacterium]|nr:SemiSWEET transporter [Chitinophagaceae bacterium]
MKTEIIGLIAGVFTASSMLPQLIKIIKEKKANDLSLSMLAILITGLGFWIYYGTLREDWPIIITNGFSLLLNIVVIILSVKYKKKAEGS